MRGDDEPLELKDWLGGVDESVMVLYRDSVQGVASACLLARHFDGKGRAYYAVCLDRIFPSLLQVVEESGVSYAVLLGYHPNSSQLLGDTLSWGAVEDDGEFVSLGSEREEVEYDSVYQRVTPSTLTYLAIQGPSRDLKEESWLPAMANSLLADPPAGENKRVVRDAVDEGYANAPDDHTPDIELHVHDHTFSGSMLASMIDESLTLGYRGGEPEKIMSMLRFSDTAELVRHLEGLDSTMRGALSDELKRVRKREHGGSFGLYEAELPAQIRDSSATLVLRYLSSRTREDIGDRGPAIVVATRTGPSGEPGLGSHQSYLESFCVANSSFRNRIRMGKNEPLGLTARLAAYHSAGHGYGTESVGITFHEHSESLRTFMENLTEIAEKG